MKLTKRLLVPALVVSTLAAGAIAAGAVAVARADSPDKHHRGGVARHALHGEFTVPQRGSAQTEVVDTQRGEITAIDSKAKSLTVKSRDGFIRTYAVTSDTKIRSRHQDQSFSDFKVGERVMVLSHKQGGKFVAQAIRHAHA